MKYTVTVEGETFEIEVGREGRVWINHRPYAVDFHGVDGLPEYSLLVDHRSYEAHVEDVEEDECQMVVGGRSYLARLQPQERRSAREKIAHNSSSKPAAKQNSSPRAVSREVCAPLPGLLVSMAVQEGQQVKQGEIVAILESMKMNMELHAPGDGVVQSLHGFPGKEVNQGDVLAVIE